MSGADSSVINYKQHRLDLQKANQDGPSAVLQWNVAYSFLEEYGLADAKPESVLGLTTILKKDDKVIIWRRG
jgi:sphingomyelin phosphodiesterase